MFDRKSETKVHIKAEQQPCKQGVRETSGLTDTQSEHPILGACGWQETVELTAGGDEVGAAVTSSKHSEISTAVHTLQSHLSELLS